MKLEELKKQASAILAIPAIPENVGDYKSHSFRCNSGGAPSNKLGIPEVHRGETAEYRTQSNGTAYSGEVVILCKSTGCYDKNDNEIYVTPDGVTFVYRYRGGSVYSFDAGSLESPKL